MSKLIMKARAGVTLVELLVVILIVTILSVSMLPLLQPFVVESQYAAEPIPVIGNLRTNIGLYQYNKGKLPCIVAAQDNGQVEAPEIETWVATTDAAGQNIAQGDEAKEKADFYGRASKALNESTVPFEITGVYNDAEHEGKYKHIGVLCNIDYADLKGNRSRPQHYQYLVLINGTQYAYFLGCFGDGVGLKKGTGYAVCEIVVNGHKYVGTWRRYKPVAPVGETDEEGQICFTTSEEPAGNDLMHKYGCWVPTAANIAGSEEDEGKLLIISSMEDHGWEF